MQTLEAFRNFRVIVVDDNPGSRENLTVALLGWGLQVVAFTACDAAAQSLERDRADIIFLDITLLEACGLEQICRFGDDLKIIVVAGPVHKTVAVRALESGAFDLVEKPFQSELLYHSVVRALKAVENERETKRLAGELKRSREDLLGQQKRLENLSSGFAIDSRISAALSFAELKIASFIKNGITTQEIARQRHIAQSTVRTHRKNIRRKLKINNAQFSLRSYLNSKS
ncbi:MAG: response regulator transcription factor [Syntrophobacteraceae bacterium]